LSRVKHSFACVLAVVGCHGSSRPKVDTKPACAPQLAELVKFYEAVAADNARPGISERTGAATVRIRELPSIGSGAPVDTSHASLLLVGPTDTALVLGDTGATVLVIDAATPWSRIEDALHKLTVDGAKDVAVAYRVPGAFAGRTPPKVPGADRIDLPSIGQAIAKTAADHCPAYATQLAGLQSGTTAISDPSLLRGLATALPTCDCNVDMNLLELMPWLVMRGSVTTVPLAASAPAHDPAQTWGELVAAAKGPVPLALPAPPPPPPPPPPPHRRPPPPPPPPPHRR
jgi:hypothetical protein